MGSGGVFDPGQRCRGLGIRASAGRALYGRRSCNFECAIHADGSSHQLKVIVSRTGSHVRARESFVAPSSGR